MTNQPRVAKVLAALLVSMTIGAVALMALGNHPPSAGPFCLSNYYRLDPIEEAVKSRYPQSPDRWNRIEIYYSGTRAGNIAQLASLNGLASPEELNCHFVVCNGLGGADGQIQTTKRWLQQWSATPGRTWYGGRQTVRICVTADGRTTAPSDYQIKRIEALVEALSRRFTITTRSVYYPSNWR